MKNRNIMFATVVIVVVCFWLAPTVQALGPDTDGSIAGSNNGEGSGVLVSRTGGIWNTGTGFQALNHLTGGNQNTATGLRALFSDTNGGFNTATGVYSLFSNTSGFFNSATGAYSLANNTEGDRNTANGYSALYYNTEGEQNTATGFAALYRNTTGNTNTANGYQALYSNTTGGYNTADGAGALYYNTTGTFNTALGVSAGSNVTTASDVICIGASGANVDNSCYIGNIFGVTTVNAAVPVLIDSAGQLGTLSSSRRYKREIKAMEQASEAILALKPVTFHHKSDPAAAGPQFGLIAEEVAEVNPDLVVRDKNGEIYTVRYDAVNAMLLNEFLKEHRKVQELEATVAQQQSFQSKLAKQDKQIEALASGLQKVSAQFEVSKFATGRIRRGGPAPRTVVNNHEIP